MRTPSASEVEDITSKRGIRNVPDVRGSDADVTAYLAGRPSGGVHHARRSPCD